MEFSASSKSREIDRSEGFYRIIIIFGVSLERLSTRHRRHSLGLSPFAVWAMFWFCVSQSDDRKSYIQFWLWPGRSIQELDQNSERIEVALQFNRWSVRTQWPQYQVPGCSWQTERKNAVLYPQHSPTNQQTLGSSGAEGCWECRLLGTLARLKAEAELPP